MLTPETPFPQVGSYGLLADSSDPHAGVELVRILERRGQWSMISFPLREGASGNKVVAHAEIIDASALTDAERREFHDLDRYLAGRSGRTARQKAAAARRNALRQRIVYGPIMDRNLRFLRARRAVQQRKAA